MTLQDILRAKGTEVYSTVPTATLAQVIRMLIDHNCGSLVVLAEERSRRMVGIITERDILRVCATGKRLDQLRVDDVMTTDVITGRIDDSVADIMGLMTDNRIRHLPLVENEELVGLISIGDVVKAQHNQLTAENHYLKNYIQG